MDNRIKKLNMQALCESICDAKNPTEEECEAIEKTCVNIEKMPEFNSLFFYADKKYYDYYYQEVDEPKIFEFLSGYFDLSELRYMEYAFIDIGQELVEDESDIEIQLGRLEINGAWFCETFRDEFLTNPEHINNLVAAGENFPEALRQLKKDCLMYIVDVAKEELDEELEDFEFDD